MEGTRKRIAVTGATGLIGSQVAAVLARRGDEVIGLVRDPKGDRAELPASVALLHWDAASTDGEWADALDGLDAVINLAGAPIAQRWTTEAKAQIRHSRVDGTRNLVAAMARAAKPPRALIQGSAVGYYGFSRLEEVDEDAPPGDDAIARLCVDWEAEARNAEASGIRVAILRFGIVLSPDGGALKQMLPPFRLFVGGRFGDGRHPWPWIHIDDTVCLILHALDRDDIYGPLNGVVPAKTTNAAFTRTLGSVMRRPALIPVPRFIFRLLFGEGAPTFLNGQNVIPRRTLESGFIFRWDELRAALGDLLE